MKAWVTLLVPSMLVGVLLAYQVKSRSGFYLSGAVPWFCFLAWLLYEEYIMPYKGGGASMWPIALLFGGTFAAVCGMAAWWLSRKLFVR